MSEKLIEGETTTKRRSLLDRILRVVAAGEAVLGGLLLLAILVLVMIQVVLRFTPTASWVWTGELAKFAMVWVTFILAGYLMGRDAHVTLDIIDHFLPKRVLRVVIGVAQLITAAICIAAAYEGYHLVNEQVGIGSPAAQIPMSFIYTVPMIGMGLTAVRCFVDLGRSPGNGGEDDMTRRKS